MDQTQHLKRKLGGIEVSALGLGCMSFSGVYGPSDDVQAIEVIHAAIDRGISLLDTSDMYGWGHNETLLGRAIKGRRDQVVLASKFGQVENPGGPNGVNGRPDYVKRACEASLRRLAVEVIDVYYQHRVDPAVPIEETVGAMSRLVEQGKVREIALSEAHPETIARAQKIHPIAAVQSEYSLLYRAEAETTLKTTRELGISFCAYSPLGRSLLTGQVSSTADLPDGDGRRRHPRFAAENLAQNLALVAKVTAFAEHKGCTPAQLVLAWLLAQGPDVVPIPGTKKIDRVIENLGALDVTLSPEEVAELSEMVPAGAAAGTRYPQGAMSGVFI
jgi:aryl-alcohol dehydrogenase-like predicted oxidoreductase